MMNMNRPDLLGIGIATAFVATVYGVGGANLIFLPLGARMRSIARHRMMYRELVMEGLLMLKKEASPMLIKDRLETLLESRLQARKEMGEAQAEEPQPMEAD
jgi:chemotaxis protein MotA